MINNILTLIGMFLAGAIFMWIKPLIFKTAKTTIINKLDDKTKEELKNLYDKGVMTIKEYAKKLGVTVTSITNPDSKEETFQVKKFLTGLGGLFNPVGWAKDFVGLFNIRKLTIYMLILSCIFAYGYWKGNQNIPVNIDLGYGKEARIDINGEYLYIDKEGNVYLKDTKTDKIIKQISVKDVPALKRKLAPIGLQFEPVFVIGSGFGDKGVEGEAGVGFSWLRYWKWRLDSFITNRGIYPLGTSYQITDNSGIGLGVGKGWEGDNRVILYYRFKF